MMAEVKEVEKWKLVGGDHGYPYLGSAIWFTRIRHAAGEAMNLIQALRHGSRASQSQCGG